MARLIKERDVKMPQVLIEAKIVEVSTNYARDLGVQWGGQYTGIGRNGTTVVTGGITGVNSGTSGGTGGSPSTQIGTCGLLPLTWVVGIIGNDYVVKLPGVVGAGDGLAALCL